MKQPLLSKNAARHTGSGLSLGGLVLVCVCFFLPFMKMCSDDFAPAQGHMLSIPPEGDVTNGEGALIEQPHLAVMGIVGLVLLVAALRPWRWGRVVAGVVLTLFLALVAVDAVLYIYHCGAESYQSSGDLNPEYFIFFAISAFYTLAFAMVGLLLLATLSRRHRWRRMIAIAVTVLCFAFLAMDSFLVGHNALTHNYLGIDPDESALFSVMICVIGALLACGTAFVVGRKSWRWRSANPWSGLLVCLFAVAHLLWWEWMLFHNSDEARYGMHLTALGFTAAAAGFWLLLLHHRSARRWTMLRWHRSRMRMYEHSKHQPTS
jgi:hypothetical protein